MLTDIMLLGHLWYNKQAIYSKSTIFRPNQNSKTLLDFSHHKDSRGGGTQIFSYLPHSPPPPL